jgi:hypothetical protein
VTRQPSILYVVPTLGKRQHYLGRALDSIAAQRGVGLEAVLVGPMDCVQARDLAKARGVEYVVQSGPGMSRAINDGWLARGGDHEYWAWLGDDDELVGGSAARAAARLERSPHASMVYGQCDYVDAGGNLVFRARPTRLAGRLIRWGPDLVPQPGSVARSSAVREAGLLDTNLSFAMDLDLFLRLKDIGPILYEPRVLARFRWHEGSTTVSSPADSDAEARLVRRRSWVGRRRIGYVLEPAAMLVGRVLHRVQKA